jgi:hypothetical protein
VGIKNGIRIVPVLLAVALAGCGDDSSGPGGVNTTCGLAGSASGTVSGAVTANLNGCAVYGISSGSTVIGVSAGSISASTHSLSLGRQGGRPAANTYTIGSGATQFTGVFLFEGGSNPDRTFVLTSGTVTITGSSAGTLTGTLTSVVATEATVAAPTVNISGSFTAKCTQSGSVTC